jgi:hypothetical protein
LKSDAGFDAAQCEHFHSISRTGVGFGGGAQIGISFLMQRIGGGFIGIVPIPSFSLRRFTLKLLDTRDERVVPGE